MLTLFETAEGLLSTDWGDHGHLQPLPISFPGYLASADFSWNVWEAAELMKDWSKATSRVSEAVNRLIMLDPDAKIGEALVLIADMYRLIGRTQIPNESALFKLLVLPNRKSTQVAKVVPGWHVTKQGVLAVQQALERVNELLSEASTSRAAEHAQTVHDPELARDELQWVADAMAIASKIGENCLHIRRPKCDLATFPRENATEIGKEMEALIAKFEALWLKRSRKGTGLKDSYQRLKHTLKVLQDGRAPEDKGLGGLVAESGYSILESVAQLFSSVTDDL
mmetsp:Transcript_20467/g.32011  ORF Transcript_20467/g.32011 Transcript_20467/m.32011 type:complete len:282 (-) Transcript_20467:197-1042(-)